MNSQEDINKRIAFLEKEFLTKKVAVERELFQIETICKELISLKESLIKVKENE